MASVNSLSEIYIFYSRRILRSFKVGWCIENLVTRLGSIVSTGLWDVCRYIRRRRDDASVSTVRLVLWIGDVSTDVSRLYYDERRLSMSADTPNKRSPI